MITALHLDFLNFDFKRASAFLFLRNRKLAYIRRRLDFYKLVETIFVKFLYWILFLYVFSAALTLFLPLLRSILLEPVIVILSADLRCFWGNLTTFVLIKILLFLLFFADIDKLGEKFSMTL